MFVGKKECDKKIFCLKSETLNLDISKRKTDDLDRFALQSQIYLHAWILNFALFISCKLFRMLIYSHLIKSFQ